MEPCRDYIYSEDVLDFFIPYDGDLNKARERNQPDCLQYVSPNVLIAHYSFPVSSIFNSRFATLYSSIPKCYTLQEAFAPREGQPGLSNETQDSNPALEAMGIGRIRRLPFLDLYGQGVLIGIVDTGIDYMHPAFVNADGTSRIYSLWDQTERNGVAPEGFEYGAEYRKEEITRALLAAHPEEIIPEKDELGHGTFVAGVAAGNIDESNRFSGVAPNAELVVVKLKQAKQYLRNFYGVPGGVPCYQETDLVQGVRYVESMARLSGRPFVLVMTMGTNSGGHTGNSILSDALNSLAGRTGAAIVTSTGNETGYSLHYHGSQSREEYEEIELRVAEGENGFAMELWASSLNLYSVAVVSPTGELIARSPGKGNRSQVMNFIFEGTYIYLDYYTAESQNGEQLVLMRMYDPTPGIWRFRIYTEQEFDGSFDIWLPVRNFLKEGTYFLRPDPDITITDPGNTAIPITVASYRVADRAIYLHSGRGYTRDGTIKPDIAAPGVDIYGPAPGIGRPRPQRDAESAGYAGVAGTATELPEDVAGNVGTALPEDVAGNAAGNLQENATGNAVGNLQGNATAALQDARYTVQSGGSAAAALAGGACALLLEWAIRLGRRPNMDTVEIKRLLKGGAGRSGIVYPNREWGFGTLDLYGAFEELRIVVNNQSL